MFLIHTLTSFFTFMQFLYPIYNKNFNTFIRHLVSCIVTVGTFSAKLLPKVGGAHYLGTKFQLIFLSPNMEFTEQVSTITSATNHVPNNAQFMLAHRYSCHFALQTFIPALTYKYMGE